ncbi:MAG: ABC transporter substrate-binding protein [Piscinibacter sp.]|nr:ABC transporter substrate-binding protein [Piscinibacter sp.]
MISLSRRGALGLLGAAAWPAVPWAQGTSIKVTQAVSSLAYIQSFVAREQGHFQQQGLAAELVNTGGGGPDVQIVLAGRAEFTVNDGAQVLPALQQGQKLTCVLALLNRSIINVTMRKETADKLGITAATPGAERIKALKGLKIGVTRPGALTWQMARYNAVSAGLDPDADMRIVALGDAPSLAAALRQGNLDAIYISVPIGEALVAQGAAVTLLDNSRGDDPTLPSFLMEGLWATPEFIKANRPLVAKTVAAYRQASAFIVRSEPEAIAKVLKPVFSGLADDVLVEGVRRVKQAVSAGGAVDAAMLENTQKVLSVNGVLKRRFAVADLYDASFLTA